ncbi:MAG: aminomethyl transferase family protein [Gammaproteobacteria bacterium]|nr:aminomethyl transferase family protein [Gammaproteobacteria bacterium]
MMNIEDPDVITHLGEAISSILKPSIGTHVRVCYCPVGKEMGHPGHAGARPAGIFAQTSVRIEKWFLAYVHDLDTDINRLQAGLGFAIDWQSIFIGKQALLDYKPSHVGTLRLSYRQAGSHCVNQFSIST